MKRRRATLAWSRRPSSGALIPMLNSVSYWEGSCSTACLPGLQGLFRTAQKIERRTEVVPGVRQASDPTRRPSPSSRETARSRPGADRPGPGIRGLARCQDRRPGIGSGCRSHPAVDPARKAPVPELPSDSAVPSSAASSTMERASSVDPTRRAAGRCVACELGLMTPARRAASIPPAASSTRPSSNCTLEIARITSDRGPEISIPCL